MSLSLVFGRMRDLLIMSLFETEVSLTSEQFDHYKWQFYYLLPWVRNVYQAMHLGIIGGEEENFEIVDAIKSLFLYC